MEATTSPSFEQKPGKKSSFVKWALVLGIAIVTNLFVSYAVQVFYPAPEFTDFCPEEQVNKMVSSQDECVKMGGKWNEYDKPTQVTAQAPGYCDLTFTCSKQYTEKSSVYNRNVFIVFIVVGIALLIGSVFLPGAEAVSLGLSFGGVLALIIGSARYWSDMDDKLRVILLGVALASLIYVAWKKFRD